MQRIKRGIGIMLTVLMMLGSTTLLAKVEFTNTSNSFGTMNTIIAMEGKIIAGAGTSIAMSEDSGMTWSRADVSTANYRGLSVSGNTVLGYNQGYGKVLALYKNQKWSSYQMEQKILGVGGNKKGFVMICEDGSILRSTTGEKDSWKNVGKGAFTTTIDKMCYFEGNGQWIVRAADKKVYMTTDFKSKKDLGYDNVVDIAVDGNKLYLLNGSIITLDQNLNLINTTPTKMDSKASNAGNYNALVILNGEAFAVGSNGGFINEKAELVDLLDRKFTYFVSDACTDGKYIYMTDMGHGVTRYDPAKKTFQSVTDNGQQITLARIEQELLGYGENNVYRFNTDGTKTCIALDDKKSLNVEEIFKRGNAYVLRDNMGRELTTTDWKTWAYNEDHIIIDASQKETTQNANGNTSTTQYRLAMENVVKIGELLFFMPDEGGKKINSTLTCIRDKVVQGEQYIVNNSVGLTIKENGVMQELGSVGITVSLTRPGQTPNRNTKSDRLVVLPDKADETTINYFGLGIGVINEIMPFKDNLILAIGELGYVAVLEYQEVGNNIELVYKHRYVFPDEAKINCAKVYNNKIYVGIGRTLYWSMDGKAWSQTELSIDVLKGGVISDIACGNGTYMVTSTTRSIAYSTDMKKWEATSLPINEQIEQLDFTGRKFIVTTYEGGTWISDPVKVSK